MNTEIARSKIYRIVIDHHFLTHNYINPSAYLLLEYVDDKEAPNIKEIIADYDWMIACIPTDSNAL